MREAGVLNYDEICDRCEEESPGFSELICHIAPYERYIGNRSDNPRRTTKSGIAAYQ
jgi:hypothetical protein